MRKLRFAVAGLHNWYHAFPYALSFKHIPGIELVAASHDNPVQLKEFSDLFGIKYTSSRMDEVIKRKDVDAVIVNAYTAAHLDLVKVACEEGKHILCDKPIEVSLRNVHEMIRHVERAGVKFMIGNEFRTLPAYHAVAELVRKGVIGDVASFDYSIHAPRPRNWMTDPDPGWYAQPEKVGHGGFFDFSVQQFDLLRFVLGKEGKRVTGVIRKLVHKELPVEDYGMAFTEFEGGIGGVVESSWAITPPGNFTESFVLMGTSGSIAVNGSKIILSGKIQKDTLGTQELDVETPINEFFRALPGVIEIPISIWYHLLSSFVKSVVEDTPLSQNIHDGLRSLELAMATYESSKRQRPVTVDELQKEK